MKNEIKIADLEKVETITTYNAACPYCNSKFYINSRTSCDSKGTDRIVSCPDCNAQIKIIF